MLKQIMKFNEFKMAILDLNPRAFLFLEIIIFTVLNTLCVMLQITAIGTKSYLESFSDTKTIIVGVDDATTSSGVLQTTLIELTAGTLYSITVAAINGAGLGESSNAVQAMTTNGRKKYTV